MLKDMEQSINLVALGQEHLKHVHRNYSTAKLYEEIVNNREGQIAAGGSIVVRTGHYTERAPSDRFIVEDSVSLKSVLWDGRNRPISQDHFKSLFYRLLAYMQNKEVYVQYCRAGVAPDNEVALRIVTEKAWHSLFARNMFDPVRDPESLKKIHNPEAHGLFDVDFSIVHIPGYHAIPELDGTNSSAFVIFNLAMKVAIIGGTSYAGELKQAVFTIINHLLSGKSVLGMRCSANMGEDGNVAVFVGRKGTGKTALALDPKRKLIGGNAHGWGDDGLFGFETGCYSKVLNISEAEEPLVYDCAKKFGTILENVSVNLDSRKIDLGDGNLTQNTRAAFPNTSLANAAPKGNCGHPKHFFLLTCDAFGVLPPIARLTPEQALFAFLSSYTSQFTGAEAGRLEAHPVFNMSFGASHLNMTPDHYANLLLEKIKKHNVTCWIMNTGWSGETHDRSERIRIAYSRTLIRAAVSGELEREGFEADPVFQFEIPVKCAGVPDEILDPRKTAANEGEYELRANRLAREFMNDFSRYEKDMPENMREMLSQVITFDESFDLLDDLNISI